jgi:hypothetical protein
MFHLVTLPASQPAGRQLGQYKVLKFVDWWKWFGKYVRGDRHGGILNISRHFLETLKKTSKNVNEIRLSTARYLSFSAGAPVTRVSFVCSKKSGKTKMSSGTLV